MFTRELIQNLPVLFAALLFAILFLQSGLDKVFNYKGNLEWLTGHFAKSPLKGTVGMMLPVLTLMEVATGVLSVVAILYFLVTGSLLLVFAAGALGAATLCALFFGQRMAQDYPGAATLVPYFLLALLMMYLSPVR
jgi:uncharacterized membrane protein YphA (DoxX/SURF4 family)